MQFKCRRSFGAVRPASDPTCACIPESRCPDGRRHAVLHRRAGSALPVRVHLPGAVRVHGRAEEGAGRQGPLSAGDAVGHRQDRHRAVADRRLHGPVPGPAGQAAVQYAHAIRDREGGRGAARVVRLLPDAQVRRSGAGRGAVVTQKPVRAPVRGRREQRPRSGRPVSRAHRPVRPGPARRRRLDRRRVRLLREAGRAGPRHRATAERIQRGRPQGSGRQTGPLPVLRGPPDARARQRDHLQLPLPVGPEDRRHRVQGLWPQHRRRIRRSAQHRQRVHRLVELAHHQQRAGQGAGRAEPTGRRGRGHEGQGRAEAEGRV